MHTYSSVPGDERTSLIPCPICGNNQSKPYWEIPGAHFVQCRDCNHVFQNPQPVFEDLKKRYQEAYFQYELENEKNFFNLMLLGLADIHFSEWEEPLRQAGAFLDVGCATGMLLGYMQNRGWKVQGVEICKSSALFGTHERGVPIFIGSLEEASFPPKSFSLVHSSHLIEHLQNPKDFISLLYDILIPQGQAVLVTPNRGGFQARLLGKRWRSCIPDHLHLFSIPTLRTMVQERGFRVLHVQTWGGIAQGLVPRWIKTPIDRWAKRWGFGDVMLFHIEKI